jgi:hypothetical protein
MVIGSPPRLITADQYGSAHTGPGLLVIVLIVVVVVVIMLSKRGK